MNTLIVDAIRTKRRLSFTYHGRPRLGEPQCYGIGQRGTELLRVHLLVGGLQPEPLFDVQQISNLVVLDEHFTRPGPHYTRDDAAMKTIYAQL
jgi:hypothetical protein